MMTKAEKERAELKRRYNITRHVTKTGEKACGGCTWWQNRQREVETLDHLLDLAQIRNVGQQEQIAHLQKLVVEQDAQIKKLTRDNLP